MKGENKVIVLDSLPGNNLFYSYLETGIGLLEITADDDSILSISFCDRPLTIRRDIDTNIIAETCKEQLKAYFEGRLKKFSLPVKLIGTAFQCSVWRALINIPYGETRSYKDIACCVNNPKAVRAVGGANNRNSIPIVIPCHRVIGADRRLVGYGGGLDKKIFLLDLEGITDYIAVK